MARAAPQIVRMRPLHQPAATSPRVHALEVQRILSRRHSICPAILCAACRTHARCADNGSSRTAVHSAATVDAVRAPRVAGLPGDNAGRDEPGVFASVQKVVAQRQLPSPTAYWVRAKSFLVNRRMLMCSSRHHDQVVTQATHVSGYVQWTLAE